MQTLTHIKQLLASRGLSPRKGFGQNFLIDHNHLLALVDASGVGEGSVVLEVGPGTGVLTEELLARGARVVAAEIDRGMCQLLRETIGADARWAERFTLVEGDCLEGKHAIAPALLAALRDAGPRFVLVANLPYGAATPLIMQLLARHDACAGIFVTIQREVVDRVLAVPGTKDYGPLSVLATLTARGERLGTLPPGCFWPAPKVTSAMLALRRLPAPLVHEPGLVLAFCHELFAQRRKQLGAVLARMVGSQEATALCAELAASLGPGVDRTTRAEALTPQQLATLCARCVQGGWRAGPHADNDSPDDGADDH